MTTFKYSHHGLIDGQEYRLSVVYNQENKRYHGSLMHRDNRLPLEQQWKSTGTREKGFVFEWQAAQEINAEFPELPPLPVSDAMNDDQLHHFLEKMATIPGGARLLITVPRDRNKTPSAAFHSEDDADEVNGQPATKAETIYLENTNRLNLLSSGDARDRGEQSEVFEYEIVQAVTKPPHV